jgi:hypothetical protein
MDDTKDILIRKLQMQLKESTECLKSILYVPEQVNWVYGEGSYKPAWLVNQIAENERFLGEKTLNDHAVKWWLEQGKPLPVRDSQEWLDMYQEWFNFAFQDFPDPK